MRMPGLNGLELLGRIKEVGFSGPVIVMTAHGDISTAVRAMKAGAFDFIEKPFDDQALLAVIGAGLEKGDSLGIESTAAAAYARIASLTAREREVLQLLMAGKPNKAIARELGLSPRTVEIHRARLMQRLEVSSLAEAVRLAIHAELGGHGR
jgi:two-component system response regulator FixJ